MPEPKFEILKSCDLEIDSNDQTHTPLKIDDSKLGDKQVENCQSYSSQSFEKLSTLPYSYLYAAKIGNE